jgi:hypothetical protein
MASALRVIVRPGRMVNMWNTRTLPFKTAGIRKIQRSEKYYR